MSVKPPTILNRVAGRFAGAPAPLRAAAFAILSALFFSCMSALIRHAGSELHPFEVVFFRNLLALAFMVPWLVGAGVATMRTQRFGGHLLRAAFSLGGMMCGFTAVTLIPITEATALGFTAPLFSTLGAAVILGETVRLRRWTAILVGFAGTMIVLRPGIEGLSIGSLLAIGNAAFAAASILVVKSLSRTEKPEVIVTYMTLILTPLSLVPALFVWQWPSLEMLAWLTVLAACGTVGHIFMTRAFATADVTVVLPFDFAKLPFTALIAFTVFGEVPTIWTWIGGAVIFVSTFYIAHRETVLARRRRDAGGG